MSVLSRFPPGIQDSDELLSKIEEGLTPGIPQGVRNRAHVTRNLIVYSWFCYDFFTVSVFWSFSCIEMALRAKYKELKPIAQQHGKHRSFNSLLKWVEREKLLPEGLSARRS